MCQCDTDVNAQGPSSPGHKHFAKKKKKKMKLKKGHNSDNDWRTLPWIKLDIYFMTKKIANEEHRQSWKKPQLP